MAALAAPHVNLRDFCARILERLGSPAEEAMIVANSLVLADLRGVDTHGVRRLPSYAEAIRLGTVRAASRIAVEGEFATGLRLDGGRSLGQVIAARAMDMAIARARIAGIASVAVRNGGHIGAHGNVAIRAAESGMLGFLVTSGRPALAPPGGRRSAVSSTPFAIASPSGLEFPLVLDMALGVVARGHILRAIAEGTGIPEGWAIDASGAPTRDARAAGEGALLPIGGYKGYGLAVMFSIIGAVLTGADADGQAEQGGADLATGQGHFLLALDIEHFMPMHAFCRRAGDFVRRLKDTPKAEGGAEVFVPGEQSYRRWRERLANGIPVSAAVADKLRALGRASGLDFDAAMSAPAGRDDPAFGYTRPDAGAAAGPLGGAML